MQALELGMVQWAVPGAELAAWAQELAGRLGQLPRQAVAACKSCIEASYDGAADGYERELRETRRLYGDADTQQRVRAFLDKKV